MSDHILKNQLTGKFIVLDGPDGCGKTTQTKLLADWLASQTIKVLTLRDPGDTPIGEKIRQILLNPEHVAMSTRAEMLLYMAARTQLWAEKIAPALKENKCVLLDRWLSSTCAYQGFAGGFGVDNVIRIAEDCLEKPWPDLTIILNVDLATAAERLNRQLDRMEQKGDSYHQKVRQGFLQLAQRRNDVIVVDATADAGAVHERIKQAIEKI